MTHLDLNSQTDLSLQNHHQLTHKTQSSNFSEVAIDVPPDLPPKKMGHGKVGHKENRSRERKTVSALKGLTIPGFSNNNNIKPGIRRNTISNKASRKELLNTDQYGFRRNESYHLRKVDNKSKILSLSNGHLNMNQGNLGSTNGLDQRHVSLTLNGHNGFNNFQDSSSSSRSERNDRNYRMFLKEGKIKMINCDTGLNNATSKTLRDR